MTLHLIRYFSNTPSYQQLGHLHQAAVARFGSLMAYLTITQSGNGSAMAEWFYLQTSIAIGTTIGLLLMFLSLTLYQQFYALFLNLYVYKGKADRAELLVE
jgi:hypothetical protein